MLPFLTEMNIYSQRYSKETPKSENRSLREHTWTGQASPRNQGGTKGLFRWLDFKITNRCNNRCTYCGVEHDPVTAKEILATSTLRETVQDAIGLGFTHYAFLGGEPSIRRDVEQIFLPFCEEELLCEIMVITNGLVFNESMYRSVFETRAERARVVFSLDSLKSPNYKNQDPANCLEDILRIKEMAGAFSNERRDRDVSIHTVISRENFQDFGDLVRMFHGLEIDVSLALVCPSHFREEGKAENFNEFTHSELGVIIKQLVDLETEGLLAFGNKTLLDYLRAFPQGTIEMGDSCQAGSQHVIINPDGEVYPCITESYRNRYKFGNIRDERFSEIYSRMMDYSCSSEFTSSCWDHYMWNRMGEGLVGGIE